MMTEKHDEERDPLSFCAELGPMRAVVDLAFANLAGEGVIERIWQRDHTVWKSEPRDVANRLGWLDIVERTAIDLHEFTDLAQKARADGYTRALLLGDP